MGYQRLPHNQHRDHNLKAEVICPDMLCYCFMKLMYNNVMRHVYPMNAVAIYMYIFHVGITAISIFYFLFSLFFFILIVFPWITNRKSIYVYICMHLNVNLMLNTRTDIIRAEQSFMLVYSSILIILKASSLPQKKRACE